MFLSYRGSRAGVDSRIAALFCCSACLPCFNTLRREKIFRSARFVPLTSLLPAHHKCSFWQAPHCGMLIPQKVAAPPCTGRFATVHS